MASQNHTATFLSLRENHQRRQKALQKRPGGSAARNNRVHPLSEGLAPNEFDGEDEESLLRGPKFTLPPTWVDLKDGADSIIGYLTDTLVRLEELHKERLVVRFDDENESAVDREIDALSRNMTKKFRDAEEKLREIGRIDPEVPDAEATIRKNVQRNLATKLQSLSLGFRRSQKEYMNKLQNQRQISSPFDDDSSLSFSANSSAFLMSQEEEQESLSKRIHHRDQEIGKIAKNVQELAGIFKELAALVIEQGTILDRIDYNMDFVVERTERGVEELDKAEKYSRSNRANYCIFALVVLIVIFFAMILMKLS